MKWKLLESKVCVCISTCMCVCVCVLECMCLCVCLLYVSVYLSLCVSLCVCADVSVSASLYLSVCLSVSVSFWMYTSLSLHVSLIRKRPWFWKRLKAEGEWDDRGWDGWMASPTQWTWLWASSGSWWWTRKPGVLQSMGSQCRTWLNWCLSLWACVLCLWVYIFLCRHTFVCRLSVCMYVSMPTRVCVCVCVYVCVCVCVPQVEKSKLRRGSILQSIVESYEGCGVAARWPGCSTQFFL